MTDKTILLVEDDPDDIELTQRALKKNHIINKLTVVRDGAEALDYFFGTGGNTRGDKLNLPTVILLDLQLPKISGMEVLKRLRSDESTRLIPVVILTSSNEEQDIIKGYSLGANSYIRKPVDFNQFVKAIQQIGQYWLFLNEIPAQNSTE